MRHKQLLAVVCLLAVSAVFAAIPAAAQSAAAPESGDFRAEYAEDLNSLEQKFLAVANALPVEKYDWRPEEGVRSFREILLHVASTNYTFPNMVGIKPPAGFDMPAMLALPPDPAKVSDAIRASFAHARAGVAALSPAAVERVLRPNWTVRRTLVFQLRHASEHLGQLIAYLRTNHITPPWTEEQQRRRQAPPAKPPAAAPAVEDSAALVPRSVSR